MDREELNALISAGPVRITMNDGSKFDIESSEFVTVSDIAASVLHRAEDGKLRHVYLPLDNMYVVKPMTAGA